MTRKAKSVAQGISVLAITGIINKVIGVLYSIPLARILRPEGLGLFQTVFPTYNLLLTVSSAGLPVAVSRLVSHYLAKDDPRNAKRVFRMALYLLICLMIQILPLRTYQMKRISPFLQILKQCCLPCCFHWLTVSFQNCLYLIYPQKCLFSAPLNPASFRSSDLS